MRSVHALARTVGWLGVLALGVGASIPASAAAPSALENGRELFNREWVRNDDRAHGGDGLGPVFNDTSCVACHNLGGTGGGGPASKNVDILTATPNFAPAVQAVAPPASSGFLGDALRALVGLDDPQAATPQATQARKVKVDTRELVAAHAGFRTARSVVLHRFGDDPGYEQSRLELLGLNAFAPQIPGQNFPDAAGGLARITQIKMQAQFKQVQTQGQAGPFALLRSQRNATALFGAGLIDTIPTSALEAAARAKHKDFPAIAGRVSRQKDGRIGRFGWKAQTPSLEDFVLTACAVELGLEVPGHHQGGLPRKPEEKAKGLDLNTAECSSLIAYVRSLPRPAEAATPSRVQRDEVAAGKALFAKVGCTACHVAKLGDVDGIYSDLLLHDMGPELGDVGQYGVFDPNSSEADFVDPESPVDDSVPLPQEIPQAVPPPALVEALPPAPEVRQIVTTTRADVTPNGFMTMEIGSAPAGIAPRPTTGPATRQEWRTPPLWGFRDSGPYLHDGRADTLEQAVALHGGEGHASAARFFGLSAREQRQIESFLKSLVAPDPVH